MAEVPKRAGPTLITAASTVQTIYTAPGASTWSIVRTINIANESASTITITVGLDTAGTDGAGERLLKDYPIIPGDSWIWTGFLVLNGHATTPDRIYVVCDTANAATVTISSVEGP